MPKKRPRKRPRKAGPTKTVRSGSPVDVAAVPGVDPDARAPFLRVPPALGRPISSEPQVRLSFAPTPGILPDVPGSTRPRARRETPPVPISEQEQLLPQSCMATLFADIEPQILAATYSFDGRDGLEPGSIAIRFAGTRIDGSGGPGDRFETVECIDYPGPQTGRVTVTTRVHGLSRGRWRVIAGPEGAQPARPLPRTATAVSTQFTAFAQGPGVRVLAWPMLVGLGAVVAVIMQALLVAKVGIPVLPVVALSAFACLLGYPGGKAWFLVANRRPVREFLWAGACIQGFLLVALSIVGLGTLILDLPTGSILDATGPGIFFGMAIGRPGCFLAGCCAGRPTASRWGLLSSDRRLGIRRIPVQLYEASVAAGIGVSGLLLTVTVAPPFPGAYFVAAIAAYTMCRQFLFRFRSQSHTRAGRLITEAACASVLLAVSASFLIR